MTTATRDMQDYARLPLRMRAETADDASLTVECVIATERAVPMLDRERWELVDEVLRADGLRVSGQVPMLDAHNRNSVDDVLGSLRGVRVDGGSVAARMHFDESDRAREAYGKVKRGHITDVSAGYRVIAHTDIKAGETATVNGRAYTAGARRMRVATAWELREGSLVPIGADADAKIRSAYEHGLAARRQEIPMSAPDSVPQDAATPTPDAQRAAPKPTAPDAVAQERARVVEIQSRGTAAGVPQEIISEAIASGDNADRASARFLEHFCKQRAAPVGVVAPEDADAEINAPYGFVKAGASATAPAQRLRELSFGLRHQTGAPIKPMREVVADYANDYRSRSDAQVRAGKGPLAPISFGISDAARGVPGAERLSAKDFERAAEEGYRYRDMSLMDYAREIIEIATGRRAPRGNDAIMSTLRGLMTGQIRSASGVSIADLQNVFTDNVTAQLIAAYELAGDTTIFVRVTDIADFRSQERPRATAINPMGLLPDGGAEPAKLNSMGDTVESYRAARFADQFAFDERAFIDDRLDLFQSIPRAMGQNAGQIRPDAVYFTLLDGSNAGLAAGAIFSSGNGNYDASSAALAADKLQAAISKVETQTETSADGSTRILNITPRYLVTGKATRWKSLELMNSTMIVVSGGTTQGVRGNSNVLANALTVVSDARFDKGCRNPFSKTGASASADADGWALVADQMYPTIEVGYVRATGRAPVIRPYMLERGQWGMGWDIKLDVGVKALDFRGLYYSKGA